MREEITEYEIRKNPEYMTFLSSLAPNPRPFLAALAESIRLNGITHVRSIRILLHVSYLAHLNMREIRADTPPEGFDPVKETLDQIDKVEDHEAHEQYVYHMWGLIRDPGPFVFYEVWREQWHMLSLHERHTILSMNSAEAEEYGASM